ncbi:hypothetical protein [uncultured Draconibacterium sp.]|uniref:hypothetical protein n=1 Tax=uncultured Draconibacterium sp. TaxID=1573823 RepID=UPI0025E5F981|nr:hypothetical protein [uncultured Draconibacterium sp.]
MKAILFRDINEADRELFEQIMNLTGNQVATTAIKEALARWLEDRKKLDKIFVKNRELKDEIHELQMKLANQDARAKNLKQALIKFLDLDS